MHLHKENRRNSGSDRFIPKRVNFDKSRFYIAQENSSILSNHQPLGEIFSQNKKSILFFNDLNESKKNKKKVQKNNKDKRDIQIQTNWNQSKIIQNGEKQILDIPGFKNDYYLNLIDAIDKKLLVTILGHQVIIYNRKQNKAALLNSKDQQSMSWIDSPTSVKFSPHQKQKVAVGYGGGQFRILDWKKNLVEQEQSPHTLRIGCFDWNPKMSYLLASGSKDKSIKLFDCRSNKKMSLDNNFHYGEICGLNWNQNGYQLASGGNDNLINIWDIRNSKKPQSIIQEHKAAVRALKWCPWQSNFLASGGGSGDMRLVIHDTNKQKIVKNIHTMSQVCAVVWDEEARTLLTAHGFSKYQMCLWDFETERLLYEFMGHRNRILSLIKPDNSNIVFSASADDTLRVWNLNQYIKPLVKKNTILYPSQLR